MPSNRGNSLKTKMQQLCSCTRWIHSDSLKFHETVPLVEMSMKNSGISQRSDTLMPPSICNHQINLSFHNFPSSNDLVARDLKAIIS